MTDKVKAAAPWWVSLLMAGFALFQQWLIQNGGTRETINGDVFLILFNALKECQGALP